MKSQIKSATLLFFGGLILGVAAGLLKGTPPAFLGWKFSVTQPQRDVLLIIGNNLMAAYITAYGPVLAWRFLGLKNKPSDMALMYMMPTIILFLNGFSTGFFIGATLKVDAITAILSIAPHGVLEIPAIVVSGAIGLKNIEGVEREEIVRIKYFAAVVVVLLLGAGIEGTITPIISGTVPPDVEITELGVFGDAVLGANTTLFIEVFNRGFRATDADLVVYVEGGGSRNYKIHLERGVNAGYYNITPHIAGEQECTVSLIWKGLIIAQKKDTFTVRKPRVELGEVELPRLYAGEDNTIVVPIENHEEAPLDLLFIFTSTTGSVTPATIHLDPGERLLYLYNASFGQPGDRTFKITLAYFDEILDQRTLNTTVAGLRVSPKILDVKIPRFEVNKSANITVTVKNTGEKGGNVSILLFEGDMPQVLRDERATNIFLSSTHIGKGIWEFHTLELAAGETRNISVAATPAYPHKGKLLIFALKREVISDVWVAEIDVTQTLS
jgi:hypothetical protein